MNDAPKTNHPPIPPGSKHHRIMKGIDFFVCDIGGHEVIQSLMPMLEMPSEAREIIGAIYAEECIEHSVTVGFTESRVWLENAQAWRKWRHEQ